MRMTTEVGGNLDLVLGKKKKRKESYMTGIKHTGVVEKNLFIGEKNASQEKFTLVKIVKYSKVERTFHIHCTVEPFFWKARMIVFCFFCFFKWSSV